HLRPVVLRGSPVVARRLEVDVGVLLVVVEAELAGDGALGAAVGAAHDLGVVLLVGPAAGDDGMAVLHVQRVVVAAPGVLAPRQRAPGAVGGPGGHAVAMVPAPGAAVARRVADLVHALRPGARGFPRGDPAHAPGLVGHELPAARRLVRPVLAPVLGDVAGLRVDQQVLEDDPAGRVLDHDHHLVAAAALGRRALVAGRQQHGFVEGEVDQVFALHGEDGGAVLFRFGGGRVRGGGKRRGQ